MVIESYKCIFFSINRSLLSNSACKLVDQLLCTALDFPIEAVRDCNLIEVVVQALASVRNQFKCIPQVIYFPMDILFLLVMW